METSTPPPSPDGRRIPVSIEEEMRGSYLAYAMSVIIGRALPDVRDGLKPVHRRVLYAMHEQRNTYNSSYKKSARIVGDVIGKYHPHGDQAVYDTIVRMAQPFSMRYLLVDGQGNFGSVDGDPAAAMRYTEVRMTRLAGELLTDLEKETVNYQENYDGSESEPTVLPAAYPNLLVNGSGGIAVGMATNMPPHNLSEVIEATIALIDNADITTEELMTSIPGPDFPTGGFIFGRRGIRDAYETGRGKIKVRAKTEIELDEKGDERAIIVTELPYQVNKARLLETIAGLVRDKKIEGIRDLRDESDRRGMRMVIELKRAALGQIVLNKLFAMTSMQNTFGIINLAIVRGQPQVLPLKELLVHFVNHRRDVVTRRCRYDLRKAQERAHILEGYIIALDNIDEVVKLIRASATPPQAREALMQRFTLSEVQAQSILDMRLQRLTGLERDKIETEYAEVMTRIEGLRAILGDDALLMALIVDELKAIEERYSDARRTIILDASGDIAIEDLIADEDMVVTLTTTGYIKRTPLSEYRTQRRGGRGRSGMSTRGTDDVANLFVASAHTLLLVFTDSGLAYPLKVYELPRGGIISSGKAIVNLLRLEDDEKVRSIVPIESLDDPDHYLVFATHTGQVKRTALDQFKNIRSRGIRAIRLAEDDDLVEVCLATRDSHVMLVTVRGQAIIFHVSNVRSMGRAAMGVRGIRLRNADQVVAMDIVDVSELLEDDGDDLEDLDDAGAADDDDDDSNEVEIEIEVEVEGEGEGEEDEGDDEGEGEGEEDEGDDEEGDDGLRTVVLVSENGYGKRVRLGSFRVQRRGGLGLRALPFTARNGPLVAMCQVKADDDLMVVTDGGTIIRLPLNEIRTYSRGARGVRIINLDEEKVVSIHAVPPSEEEDDSDEEFDGDGEADAVGLAEEEDDGLVGVEDFSAEEGGGADPETDADTGEPDSEGSK